MLSGLMVLHLYYWGTNQFIVQRTLGARSDWDARMGTIAAGFFKLLIPFLCIVPGMAAGYILAIDPATESDTAFAGLTRELLPAGYGLVGVVMAGLVAGILSTIDSMMNSTATLFTFDIYKKYIRPEASEMRLIWVGRGAMMLMVGAGDLAVAVLRPDQRGHLQPHGRLQRLPGARRDRGLRGRHLAAAGDAHRVVRLHSGRSVACRSCSSRRPTTAFDHELQAFHRAGLATLACYVVLLVVSLATQHERDPEREQYTWSRFKRQRQGRRRRPPRPGGRTTSCGPACSWPARWGCAGFSGEEGGRIAE